MKSSKFILFLGILSLIVLSSLYLRNRNASIEDTETRILHHEVDLHKDHLRFFLKDEQGHRFKSLGHLKKWLKEKDKNLIFATNGGMYNKSFSPVGLYIENSKILSKIDSTKEGYGNFYLQPNGIFYLTKEHKGFICKTSNFPISENITYATQSGPMLLIDGAIHSKFNAESTNLNIRNGVGILPNGKLLFAMSKDNINFYNFANFFLEKGCSNALYLDGFVSRTYLPSQNWIEEDGNFGVIIGQF